MFLKDLKEVILEEATVVEEPEFKFETPKFKPKLDLPKASENPRASNYLKKRKLNPTAFLLY